MRATIGCDTRSKKQKTTTSECQNKEVLSNINLLKTEDIEKGADSFHENNKKMNPRLKFRESTAIFEECYNLAVKADNLNDPIVLSNYRKLWSSIYYFIDKEQYLLAEQYARKNHEFLTQYLDTYDENIFLANAADLLAIALQRLIKPNEDEEKHSIVVEIETTDKDKKDSRIVEIETLLRKSLRIRMKLIGPNDGKAINALNNLSFTLKLKKGDHNDERRKLCERALSIDINDFGIDAIQVAEQRIMLTEIHSDIANEFPIGSEERIKQLHFAESYAKAAVLITTKLNSPSFTLYYKSLLSDVVMKLQRDERILRIMS